MDELTEKWEALKSAAANRGEMLDDSLQAHQYFTDSNEAESWMQEKVGSLRSLKHLNTGRLHSYSDSVLLEFVYVTRSRMLHEQHSDAATTTMLYK